MVRNPVRDMTLQCSPVAATIILEKNVGFSVHTSALYAGFIQLSFWAGTLPTLYALDRYGRRPVLLFGSIGMTISLILFTVGIAIGTKTGGYLSLSMLFIYEFIFGTSRTPIPWVLAPEITPLSHRHIGGALSPGSEWLWTFVSRSTGGPMQQAVWLNPCPRLLSKCCRVRWRTRVGRFTSCSSCSRL